MLTRTEVILRDLVALQTVSSRSNDPALDYAEGLLAPVGWQIERRRWIDEQGVSKSNLLACTHRTAEPDLALCGHVDTVPVDPQWSDAFALRAEADRLHGLGACDMKGFVASALALAERTPAGGPGPSLMLVLTADEEIGCLGAKRLAAESDLRPRRAIVGEPTGLQPVRAGKGYGLARLTVRGREAHSAFPGEGHSAIYDAARVLLRLEEFSQELTRSTAPAYRPPHPTINVGLIRGGTAKNIVPGQCELTVEFRSIGAESPVGLAERVRASLESLRGVAEFEFEVLRADAGFELPAAAAFTRTMETLTGQPAGTVSFGTEAPYFAALGAEVIVCGPGEMTRAHRRDEFITRSELAACDALLAKAAGRG
ncbi:MAG: acetylornithine deacetylase [Verrucomicrobia bacterium]|nr:acetylornithine deacetylase [Verrucomicrobiota bacterium]